MGFSSITAEAYLTIAVIVAASALTVSLNVSLQKIGDAERERALIFKRDMEIMVSIIFASQYNSTSVKVWIKNVGRETIEGSLIGTSDNLFFGKEGLFQHIPYNQTTTPTWIYVIVNDLDNDGNWDPSETIEITINYGSTLDSGDYFVRYSAYNGATSDYTFSL
jgi:flagellar protein FlaG